MGRTHAHLGHALEYLHHRRERGLLRPEGPLVVDGVRAAEEILRDLVRDRDRIRDRIRVREWVAVRVRDRVSSAASASD